MSLGLEKTATFFSIQYYFQQSSTSGEMQSFMELSVTVTGIWTKTTAAFECNKKVPPS